MTRLCRYSLLAVLVFLAAWASAQNDSKTPAIRTIYPTFTTIDVPGAYYSEATAINNVGQIVGEFGQDQNVDTTGFLYENGTFTTFYYPADPPWTNPFGINDSGLISGYYGRDPTYGFTYDGTTFTTLQDGGDNATIVYGINNAGVIVGGQGTIYTTKAFELRGKQYKPLKVPGLWNYINAVGINNYMEISGEVDNQEGFQCKNGTCQLLAIPGTAYTVAQGINDKGVIVGWYFSGNGTYSAFAYVNGRYLSFTYPGATLTLAEGINNAGEVVGEYTFGGNVMYHGFVTSPITADDFGEDGNAR